MTDFRRLAYPPTRASPSNDIRSSLSADRPVGRRRRALRQPHTQTASSTSINRVHTKAARPVRPPGEHSIAQGGLPCRHFLDVDPQRHPERMFSAGDAQVCVCASLPSFSSPLHAYVSSLTAALRRYWAPRSGSSPWAHAGCPPSPLLCRRGSIHPTRKFRSAATKAPRNGSPWAVQFEGLAKSIFGSVFDDEIQSSVLMPAPPVYSIEREMTL